ncbi:hypothetical protein ACIGEZ_10330 [Streptomyces sp. NPDC085481]|uniref:hypothetical protein n=1 Tax=Streptomyces sp. NPDC085481 TaxID=3365727 RepID=UPI0037D2A01B
MAVLAPLTISSLLLGSVALTMSSAQAVPSATCTVKESATAGKFDVTGKGWKPGKIVFFESNNTHTATRTANAAGEVSVTAFFPAGTITALQPGVPEATCGTVKETEQKDAQEQYRMGYRQGVADTKEDCKKEPPKQGVAALDPNYEKGYNAGAAAVLASALCK